MKTRTRHFSVGETILLVAGIVRLGWSSQVQARDDLAAGQGMPGPTAISWSELGTKANAQTKGEGLTIEAVPGGARLRCAFQRLEGDVTTEGLWLVSTVKGKKSDRFCVKAVGVGRDEGQEQSPPTVQSPRARALPRRGRVETAQDLARWVRPGLVEEYSVSVDGVRQDFVVMERPAGVGQLQVDVALSETRELTCGAEPPPTPGPPDASPTLLRQGLRVASLAVKREGKPTKADLLAPPAAGRLGDRPCRQMRDSSQENASRLEQTADGACLILRESGRRLAYNRLRATDTDGRDLPARIQVASRDRLSIVVDDAGATYPIRIDPTFSDANWQGMGGVRGIQGVVHAATVDPVGNLYVGGQFDIAGNVPASNIAKWDGTAWSALGWGIGSDRDGVVLALAVDRWGTLYAGGSFSSPDGAMGMNIAKWDGGAWSTLGPGLGDASTTIWALALDGSGNLYVGGSLVTGYGETLYGNLAKWNGSTWSGLGSGMDYDVYALAFDGSGNLYAGGAFTNAGGVGVDSIAKWNGSVWSALGSGMNAAVWALAWDGNGNLYAGGPFTNAGGARADNVAKWNGSTWSALGAGISGTPGFLQTVYALAVDGSGNLYAGGTFTNAGGVGVNNIAKWNGSVWSALGSGTGSSHPNVVRALAVDGSGNLYAGGQFRTAGAVIVENCAKWSGSAWNVLGSGMDSSVYALASDGSGNLYAGGMFNGAGSVTACGIAKWNGSAWSALGAGMPGVGRNGQTVNALAVDGSGNLYAGGSFTNAGGVAVNNIAKWNGSVWSALGSGTGSMFPNVVRALVVDGEGNLYAGGQFSTAGGIVANNIARWDGGAWNALGSGMNDTVYTLAVDGSGNLYAGGAFTTAGGASANRVAKWSGNAWGALGAGLTGTYSLAYPSTVRAIVLDASGHLCVGGTFTNAGGASAINIAKWNGVAWSALASGMHDTVYALAADESGNLYAGGAFGTVDGVGASRIAKWDGSAWSALGSGIDAGNVWSLALDGRGNLYVGGYFFWAGGKVSAYTACAKLFNLSATVGTSPAGCSFTVDGTSFTRAQAFSWEPGSVHTIGTMSPQSSVTTVRHRLSGWSDGGAMTHTVTATTNWMIHTANFSTEYKMTMTVGAGGGIVVPASGWTNAGAVVPIRATAAHGYRFASWSGSGSGSYSGSLNPSSIIVNGPITEVANFTTNGVHGSLTVRVAPAGAIGAGAQWRVDGGTWQNSGSSLSGLLPGPHTVSFKEVGGGTYWVTPADLTMTVLADQTVSATVTYVGPVPYAVCNFPVSFAGKDVLVVKYDLETGGAPETALVPAPSEVTMGELKPNRWYWVALDVKDGSGHWQLAFATYIARFESSMGRWIGALPTTYAAAPYQVSPPNCWLLIPSTADHQVITVSYYLATRQMGWGQWQQNAAGWVGYSLPFLNQWYYLWVADSATGLWY